MDRSEELEVGERIAEGKTKLIYSLKDQQLSDCVLIESKDRITAGDGVRANTMQGKAKFSNSTTCSVFKLLASCRLKTHFVRMHSDRSFIARACSMVPLEVVIRRLATGSFLKRHPGVKEGFRFVPPLTEYFFKDDANHDPQWSKEQILEAALVHSGVTIGRSELALITETALAVFEILERAWASLDVVLVDMKVEFGVCLSTKEILLADVIDNDSWRIWPAGDKSRMLDKQIYRNMTEVNDGNMAELKKNYTLVAELCERLVKPAVGRVVVFMGSAGDLDFCKRIQEHITQLGIKVELRVTSAHKTTEQTLAILRQYEADGEPTVFLAVAGRSNGLGPVLSANTSYPVINCPPLRTDWVAQDVWSSLHLPSGLGCTTVIDPEAAALAAAQILALHGHAVWCALRARRLNMLIGLILSDCACQELA